MIRARSVLHAGAVRSGVVAALDVGTSKVVCFVARVDNEGAVRVIGIGHQVSRGMRNGSVVDLDATERAIRAAVEAAERMAGETVQRVFVSVSCGHPLSHTVGVEVPVEAQEIGDHEIRRVLDQGLARAEPGERAIIHAVPTSFSVDGTAGVGDPRGMAGRRLGLNMHIVTADAGPLRNVQIAVERALLGIDGMVISPYASGLATLVDDEMSLGVTLVDLGGGTTSIAVFQEGVLTFADVVPVGGQHVTNDIARGLATPTVQAERMKTLYGNALPSPLDERDLIDVPQVGESAAPEPNHVPRSALIGIIRPRIEETFEMVRERLHGAGVARKAGRRLVLTGGASQLPGIGELAGRILDKQARMGRPIGITGLAESTCGPAFAACVGLLIYAARGYSEALQPQASEEPSAAVGGLTRIGRWLRQNF